MKRILIIALMGIALIPAMAQQQQNRRFNPEEFKARAIAYLSEKAGLTSEEANAFFPVFEEFKNKQRGIYRQIHQLKKECPASDEAAQNAIIRIAELERESATLAISYYRRLCKIIPAQKVYKVILAEDAFHRDMLQKFGKSRPQQNGKRNERQ